MNDLTAIFYTANNIPHIFGEKVKDELVKSLNGLPLISVSQKPMDFGKNICVGDIGRTHINIYRQALIGAKEAKTKYIALVEDDILYSPEHFTYIPTKGKFAYNMSVWSIYTWKDSVFSYKDRRNLHALICERDLFIETMEERFKRHPVDEKVNLGLWAEPGKYERQLDVTVRESEMFYTDIPNIAFSHPTALSYLNLGERKRLGNLKVTALPYWGTIEEIKKLYV